MHKRFFSNFNLVYNSFFLVTCPQRPNQKLGARKGVDGYSFHGYFCQEGCDTLTREIVLILPWTTYQNLQCKGGQYRSRGLQDLKLQTHKQIDKHCVTFVKKKGLLASEGRKFARLNFWSIVLVLYPGEKGNNNTYFSHRIIDSFPLILTQKNIIFIKRTRTNYYIPQQGHKSTHGAQKNIRQDPVLLDPSG